MTTPGGNFPPDAITGADLTSLDGLNESSWRAGLNADVIGSPGGNKGFNGLNTWVKDATESLQAAIQDLQDQTQILEGVIGYGQWYAPDTSGLPRGAERLAVMAQTQSGPAVGCYMDSGRIYFQSKGLWRVDARAVFLSNGNGQRVSAWIRCKSPGGALITEAYTTQYPDTFGLAGAQSQAGTIHHWMYAVVPEPGCYIEVWLWADGDRNFPGGINNNSISVYKHSNELGPGMRLSQPFMADAAWRKLSPMLATGGGAVTGQTSAIVGQGVTNARVDAVVVGDGDFGARLVRNSTVLQTKEGAAAHSFVWEGAVAPGDALSVEVRGEGSTVFSQSNATWLTIMNKGQSVSG